MPIKLKYPSKPDFYDITVGDLLAMLTDVPRDTLLSDRLEDINAITFVLF